MQRLRKNIFVLSWLGITPLAVTAWLSLAANVGWAQPANNNFDNAQVIAGPTGLVTGDNFLASKEPGEPDIIGIPGGASVWYSWTAPSAGIVTFTTFGSDFDTLLGVYFGPNLPSLTPIAGNDDAGGTLQSSVTFNAAAGTTYMITVDGFFGSEGNIILNWGLGGGTLSAGDFRFTSPFFLVSP